MDFKKYISLVIALATFGSLAMAIPAFAQNAGQPAVGRGFGKGMMPAVMGTVSAINGNTITILGRQGFNRGMMKNGTTPTTTPAAVTYTIDATNAKVTKNNSASTVSAIAVGDTVAVQGTISGTNITATIIRDGAFTKDKNQNQPVITGNGQPVVAGAVTAISGNSVTITNKSNVTYTVDTTNAKIVNGPVATGDNLVVQGTVNGTNVTASSIIDQKTKPKTTATQSQGFMGGMMNGIGNFFKKLFGF